MNSGNPQHQADAKRFLEDETTKRTLALVTAHYRKMSEGSAHDDVGLREYCYHQLSAVREFHRQLTVMAGQGTFAKMRKRSDGSGSD